MTYVYAVPIGTQVVFYAILGLRCASTQAMTCRPIRALGLQLSHEVARYHSLGRSVAEAQVVSDIHQSPDRDGIKFGVNMGRFDAYAFAARGLLFKIILLK